MELPANIREIIEEEAEKYPLKQLSAASGAISAAYRENTADGKQLVSGKIEALAYAAVRMPATYAAAMSVLEQCSCRSGGLSDSRSDGLFGEEISTLLDAGAGCGAFSFAAAESFPSLRQVICLERAENMLETGKMLMKRSGFPCGYEWRRANLTETELPRAHLVSAAYTLNEIPREKRPALVKRLWEAAEKQLIIIEPGTPAGFAGLLETRTLLRSLGAEILAPCPKIGECPLPENDWCHFTARVARSKLHKRLKEGDAPYEDEKFCYIAAVRGSASPCAARILRHPRIESGRITLRLCTPGGMAERTATKKDGADFKRARKANSGDAF